MSAADNDSLLDDQERRLRKAERKAEQLPDPETFGKLRLAILLVDGAAAVNFVIGTLALLTALVLRLASVGGASIVMMAGVLPTVLGLALFPVEAALVGAFLMRCYRIVKVLTPGHEDHSAMSLADCAHEAWNGIPFLHQDNEDTDQFSKQLAAEYGGLPFLAGAMLMVPAVVVMCFTLGPIMLIFLAMYLPFALLIYRLGYRLNTVVDHYRLCDHGIQWAPIGLGFSTALSGLGLLAGPLSGVFFVLLPIWVFRTAEVAASICRADPALFVEKVKPPEPPPMPPPASPFDLPANTTAPSKELEQARPTASETGGEG